MHDWGRSRAGTRGRIAALIASLLAVVLVFASVVAAAAADAKVRSSAEVSSIGPHMECGDAEPLPFAKLAEGEGSGDAEGENEKEKFDDAAISGVDWAAFILLGGAARTWECPSQHRARAGLGAVGARGPPVG